MYEYEVWKFYFEVLHLSTDTTQSRHNLLCLKVTCLSSIVENIRTLQVVPVHTASLYQYT